MQLPLGLFQRREADIGQRRGPEPARAADHALEPQHHDPVAAAEQLERILHRPDVGQRLSGDKAAGRRLTSAAGLL